jgi:hypothetical protein
MDEEVDGVREKGFGDTTTFDIQTPLEAFLNMCVRSACFIDEAFSGKKQNFRSWDYLLEGVDYQDFHIIRCQIEEIVLY